MPRRKQSVPKKHGNEPDSSSPKPQESTMETQNSPHGYKENTQNKSESPSSSPDTTIEDSSNGEVLDLSIKRRKISSTSTASSISRGQSADQKLTPSKVQSTSSVIVMPPFLGALSSPKSLTSSPTGFSGVHPMLSPAGFLGDRNCASSLPSTSSSPLPPKKRSANLLAPLVTRNDPATNCNSSGPGSSGSSADALSSLTSLVSKVGATQSILTPSPAAIPSLLYQTTGSPTGPPLASPAPNEPGSAGAAGGGLNFQDLWLRFVKKEENAELKRMNEARKIFTCLQCETSFQSMDQLVKHMEATQHYTNIPKHYSWSLQMARQRMRHMKMKMKYSDKMMYFCFLCQNTFAEPVHVHFNCMHNMHNPAENMKFVHIISIGSDPSSSSKNSTSKNSSRKNAHNNLSSSFSIPSSASTSNGTNRGHSHVTSKFGKKEAPGASGSHAVKTNDKSVASTTAKSGGSSPGKMNDLLAAAILTGFDDQSKLLPCNSLSKMEELVGKKSTSMKLRSDKTMSNGNGAGSETKASLPNGRHSKSEG